MVRPMRAWTPNDGKKEPETSCALARSDMPPARNTGLDQLIAKTSERTLWSRRKYSKTG